MERLKLSFDLVSSAVCWPEQLIFLKGAKEAECLGLEVGSLRLRTHWWSGKDVCGTGFSILRETDELHLNE